jgi:hypothetical protein
MSTTLRPRIKSQSVGTKCQVEIVDLKGSYLRSAGTKSAAILDATKLCRVEEFAARHFRHSQCRKHVEFTSDRMVRSFFLESPVTACATLQRLHGVLGLRTISFRKS